MKSTGKHILITGGAGFIGSHLSDLLLRDGHAVRILDNLDPQVHGPCPDWPDYLDKDLELMLGDVRDSRAIERALDSIDAVFHLAAAVGVGQSMYEIQHYTAVNAVGTATLLQALTCQPVQKLVIASSMSVYGEGSYSNRQGDETPPTDRGDKAGAEGAWEMRDLSGDQLVPVPTAETKAPAPSSIYAHSKYFQEQASLCAGAAYRIPTVALRFFNAYGPRQSLLNPYTGVIAIFAARLRTRLPPLVYEDGLQMRDFVSVHDIARACVLALHSDRAVGQAINVGSGRPVAIKHLARDIGIAVGAPRIEPIVTGKYRSGDIRHCFADISRARALLDFSPRVTLQQGLEELAAWLNNRRVSCPLIDPSAEMAERGLSA